MFAVRYAGSYLWIQKNHGYSSRRRELRADVTRATIWASASHALLAIGQAMQAGIIPRRAEVDIVPLIVVVDVEKPARRVRANRGRTTYRAPKFLDV